MGKGTKFNINNPGNIGHVGDIDRIQNFLGVPHIHDAGHADPRRRAGNSSRPEPQPDLNIIFLSSTCEGSQLGVDREFNCVHQRLSDTNPTWARCLEHWPDARLDQLASRVMRSDKPTILHFGGHGDPYGRLVLRDHQGQPMHMDPKGLCRLLDQFASKIRVVVLNACYSEVLAKELVSVIDVVIGMNDTIDDETAILFSQSFYEGLATNLSVKVAFGVACSLVIARRPEVEEIPNLYSRGRVDPATITFGVPPALEGR